MFKNAPRCLTFTLFWLLLSEWRIPYAFADEKPNEWIALKRVELFPAGQGVFEYEADTINDTKLSLLLSKRELDDLLKSLVIKGFDAAHMNYQSDASKEDTAGRVLVSDASMTRAELLQGLKGHSVSIDQSGIPMTGKIVAVEQQQVHEQNVALDVEVVTLRTEKGIQQTRLTEHSIVSFSEPKLQQLFDNALSKISKSEATRNPATLHLKKKERGAAGIAFQMETAPWKCSYRVAKIEGKFQLVVAAVVDNVSGVDWENIELVLVVDQPLSFHAPLSQVQVAERNSMRLPAPFSAAPPSLLSGRKRKQVTDLFASEPIDGTADPFAGLDGGMRGYGGGGMGGMGGFGGGSMGGGSMGGAGVGGMETAGMGSGYSRISGDGEAIVQNGNNSKDTTNRRLGMTFSQADFSRELVGKRVQIRLPNVTILAGSSETLFLPAIPHSADDVFVYVPSISSQHPLVAIQVTLQKGYQLPGGPGTVWGDSGYEGDVMFPRLFADVPQMVTYSLDHSVEVKSKRLDDKNLPSEWEVKLDSQILETTKSERVIVYSVENESERDKVIIIEHKATELGWIPEAASGTVREKEGDDHRYELAVATKKSASLDVRENRSGQRKWNQEMPRGELDAMLQREDLTNAVRAVVTEWVRRRQKIDSLQSRLQDLNTRLAESTLEQKRIHALMPALTRVDALHSRYLEKLSTLEDAIEKATAEIVSTRLELEAVK